MSGRTSTSRWMMGLVVLFALGAGRSAPPAAEKPDDPNAGPYMVTTKAAVLQCTPKWTGTRMADGRPMVNDDIIKRMRNVPVTMAWTTLTNAGYRNCFENANGWVVIHPDEVICGRVLSAQYMPMQPDINAAIMKQGKAEGRIGNSNSWPIDMLQKGDVYVADGYGRVVDGTLIGDNLGNSIYAKSGNGVIFNGGVRDQEGLEEIKGFNAWHKGSDPSFLKEEMLTGINVPIRIGRAIVCPGDVVLAKREGMVFIPAHMAEEVVRQSEATTLRDLFGHQRLIEGKYTPGQIDSRWTAEIQADFRAWLKENADKLPVPKEAIDAMLNSTQRNY